MATVTDTQTAGKYIPKAFYAHLGSIEGLALRTSTGEVHFQTTSTGLWTQLTNADAPRLTLHGRVDIAAAQALADGDLYQAVQRRNTEHARVAA